MFNGKNWEVVFTVEKADGTKVKATPVEYFSNTLPARIIQIIRERAKEMIDRFDFRSVVAEATQIDWVDQTAGKVYYTASGERHSFSLENEQTDSVMS